jgi:hypothetical protein
VPECCATQAGEYPNADQVVVPEEAAIAMVECLDDAAEQGDNACERMAYALQQFVAQGYGRLLRAEVIVYPVKDRGAKPIIATERLLADVFRAGVTWVREKAHLITDPSLSPHMWWPTTTDMQRAAGKLAEEIVTKKAVTFIQDQLPVDEQGSTILPAVKEETPEQEREQEYVRIHALSQRTGNYDPYAVREWSMVQLLHLMDEAAALKEG